MLSNRVNVLTMHDDPSGAPAARHNRFPTEKEMQQANLIQDRIWMFKTWKECFVAKDAVSFMVANGYADNAKHAVELAQEQVKEGKIYYLGESFVGEWLVGWLVGWVEWLIDWLVGWLSE